MLLRLRRGAAAAAWCCGCGVEGVEHGGAWSTEARAAGVMAARARVRSGAGWAHGRSAHGGVVGCAWVGDDGVQASVGVAAAA